MRTIRPVNNFKSTDKVLRDPSHEEFVVRWANFVKDNPDKWQPIHSKFINAQINNSMKFLKRLSRQKGGKQKLMELYSIKNKDGYKGLLS